MHSYLLYVKDLVYDVDFALGGVRQLRCAYYVKDFAGFPQISCICQNRVKNPGMH
jgi:hypothetical protein